MQSVHLDYDTDPLIVMTPVYSLFAFKIDAGSFESLPQDRVSEVAGAAVIGSAEGGGGTCSLALPHTAHGVSG